MSIRSALHSCFTFGLVVAVTVSTRVDAQDYGLLAHWDFEQVDGGRVPDLSGNGNHGELRNGASITAGKDGKAVLLDGRNDYVYVGHTDSLDINRNYTITALFKTDRTDKSQGLVTKVYDSEVKQYRVVLERYFSGGWEVPSSRLPTRIEGGVVTTGAWTHLAFSVSEDLMLRLYINGTLVHQLQGGNAAKLDEKQDVSIGRYGGTYNKYFFEGLIDDVRIYGRVLNDGEIASQAGDLLNRAPTDVSITADDMTPTVAQEVAFAASAIDPDGDELAYTWNFGDGSTGSGANVGHAYTSGGSYRVTCRVSDGQHTVRSNQLLVTTDGAPPIAALRAFWHCDENGGSLVADAIGDNDGTIRDSVTWSEGRSGSALGYAGSGYVEIPHSNSLSLVKDFAITAWIKPSSVDGEMTVISKVVDTERKNYYVDIRNGLLVYGAEPPDEECIGGTIQPGVWQHVAVVVDSTRMVELYVNGSLVAQRLLGGDPGTCTTAVNIGRRGGSYRDREFHGLIDEVALHNVPLSATEVRTLAEAYGALPPTVFSPQLLPPAYTGIVYAVPCQASGSTPITWSLNGQVPPGLTIDADSGELSGIPTTAGSYAFEVCVTNAAGSGRRSYVLAVEQALIATLRAITLRRPSDPSLEWEHDATGATGTIRGDDQVFDALQPNRDHEFLPTPVGASN